MGKVATCFGANEAARLAGLSTNMLDYLCRAKVAVPTECKCRGRGHRRMYSFGDVVMLRSIAKLLDHGFSVYGLRTALAGLRKRHPEITPTALPATWLVSVGNGVFFKGNNEVIEDLKSGQLVFGFFLELATVRNEVLEKLMSAKRRV